MLDNYFEMKVKAKLDNVAVVRVAISAFVSNISLTIDELMDIKTAVSEAVTNSIEHGYDGILAENSSVEIQAYLLKEDDDYVVKISVKDNGIGIDDIELAMTPAYTSKPELEHAGMGFTVMESFMDEVIIDSTKSEGTMVTLYKKINTKKSNG